MILDEAYITKDMGNGMKVRMGQFKPPFMREELISSSRQLAVERSLVFDIRTAVEEEQRTYAELAGLYPRRPSPLPSRTSAA